MSVDGSPFACARGPLLATFRALTCDALPPPPWLSESAPARAAGGGKVAMGWEEMREALRKAGQDHVLKPPPPAKRRDAFLSQLCSIDLEGLPRMLETSLAGAEEREVKREPFPDVVSLAELPSDKVSSLRARGLTMIAKGEVAALLLAGGQGTRLGTSAPKGCYDIGLPSGKSLFQYHAEKILKVRRLAAAHAKVDESTVRLRLLVMTSDATDEETKIFFAKHE